MEQATIIGIDLAKGSFQVHGARADGSVAFRKKLSRDKVLDFVASQLRCVVAMEACASSHHWGRAFGELGHEVNLIPAVYVKPFVKRQKNDAADAEAICEAAARPTMRFMAVENARAAGSMHAVSHAGSAGSSTHADDQRAAGTLCGVRRHCSAGAGSCGAVGRGG